MLRAARTHLPLAREVTVTRGDAEEERVELCELGGIDEGIIRLCGCVHFLENLLRERLGDS